MVHIQLPHNWTPRPSQQPIWNELGKTRTRFSICAHRRFGKDDLTMAHTACASQERTGGYWHLLPKYEQARKAIWDSVNPHTGKRRIDEHFPMEMRETTREQEMFIKFKNGSTWQLAGSDNHNSLVGASHCGLAFSEYSRADPSAWAYLRPILRENKGWAIFISTPFGKNHFYRLHQAAQTDPEWASWTLPADRTGIFTAEELDQELKELQAEHGETYGRSIWLQEYFCSFEAAIPGSFWAESIDALALRGAICDFAHDRQRSVFTVGDLGRTDDTAIWFYQINGDQLDIVDYWAGSGYEIYEPSHPERSIVHALLEKAKTHGYRYAQHWWPHDARPRRLGMGGKSILQQFQDAGKKEKALGTFAIVPRLDVQEGIQAGRKTFQHVRRVHKTRCEIGLEALRHYHREWDAEKKVYMDHPVHDWSSHCFTGDTEVLTRYGMRSISSLPKEGEVLTLCGWTRYENPRITRRHAQLVEVGFSDGLTVKCTPDHSFLTDNGWISARSLKRGSLIQSSLTHSPSISMVASIAYGQVINTCREAGGNFIEMCGQWPLVQFLKDVISITKTAILRTTSSPISNAYQQVSIYQQGPQSVTPLEQSTLRMRQELRLPPGIGLKKVGYGTGDTWTELKLGQNGSESLKTAPSVRKSFKLFREIADTLKFIVAKSAKCRRIAYVEDLDEVADVWCLTVPEVEHFSLSNGSIVHNCADGWRYLSLSWRPAKIMHPEPEAGQMDVRPPRWGDLVKQHFERRHAMREGREVEI